VTFEISEIPEDSDSVVFNDGLCVLIRKEINEVGHHFFEVCDVLTTHFYKYSNEHVHLYLMLFLYSLIIDDLPIPLFEGLPGDVHFVVDLEFFFVISLYFVIFRACKEYVESLFKFF